MSSIFFCERCKHFASRSGHDCPRSNRLARELKAIPAPEVVNLRNAKHTHYIGRGFAKPGVINLGLGNPYALELGAGTFRRAEVIGQFEAWVRAQPTLMQRIKSIPPDATLGCWCAPKACHGDVIVKLWKEMNA